MKQNLILSICIPTNNRADFLKKNLHKLARIIDPKTMEIVIGNDACTDNTGNVLKGFTKKYPKIRLVEKKFTKRIFFDRIVLEMVKASSGDFCWLLGDDDFPTSGSIKKIKSIINKYPKLSLIHLNYSRFDNLLKKVTAKKMINGINSDLLFENYTDYYFKPIKNSYFKFLGTHTITMSTDVVNRKKWLRAAKSLKKFIGHNFIHSFVIGTIIKGRKTVYFVSKPQVQYLSNNHRVWPNDIWKDYNKVLLNYLKKIGYPSDEIHTMQKQQSEYEKREGVMKNPLLKIVYQILNPFYSRFIYLKSKLLK